MINAVERLALFVQILDPADYGFLRSLDARRERTFRRDRVRIFRRELRVITRDAAKLFRVRRLNLAQAGRWNDYVPLLGETAGGFLAIAKLWLAGILLAWRIPMVVNAGRSADRLARLVTSQKFS
jgi:hypothetical protein